MALSDDRQDLWNKKVDRGGGGISSLTAGRVRALVAQLERLGDAAEKAAAQVGRGGLDSEVTRGLLDDDGASFDTAGRRLDLDRPYFKDEWVTLLKTAMSNLPARDDAPQGFFDNNDMLKLVDEVERRQERFRRAQRAPTLAAAKQELSRVRL